MFQLYLAILSLIAFLSLKPEFIPNKVKGIGIKLIYNTIYFYSACQIKCNQAYNYLLPYFKNAEVIDQITIEQFNIDTGELLTITKNILDIADKFENKLFIISKIISNNLSGDSSTSNNISITNKLIIDKNNICLSFDTSNITFIALYLNYNGVRFNINLKTDEFNYYLVGNKIDKHFIQYYINTVLCLKFSYVESEITTYVLELMDHQVNMVHLSYEQSIIIEKDGYRIIKEDVTEVEDVTNDNKLDKGNKEEEEKEE
jgi:hypothetical protein